MVHKIPVNLVESHASFPPKFRMEEATRLYNSIKNIFGETHEVFLQGSYGNDTPTYNMNDVDVMLLRKNTYSGVYSKITVPNKIAWDNIFSDIETILGLTEYRGSFSRADKCIKIKTSTMGVDIVPAVKVFEDYTLEPIVIHSFRENNEILAHPRTHIANGTAKHQRTNNMYKPTVRFFKSWSINHFGNSKIFPSFYIESLVYSEPDPVFSTDLVETFIKIGMNMQRKLANGLEILSVAGDKNITLEWNRQDMFTIADALNKSVSHALKAVVATSQEEAIAYWKNAVNI